MKVKTDLLKKKIFGENYIANEYKSNILGSLLWEERISNRYFFKNAWYIEDNNQKRFIEKDDYYYQENVNGFFSFYFKNNYIMFFDRDGVFLRKIKYSFI